MMIRNLVPGVAVAAALGLLGGCALQARTDSDPRASVATCHNYAFADSMESRPDAATAFGNPLNEKRLRDAIAGGLNSHGLPAATDAASADCVVGYAIGSRLAPDPASPRFSWGLGMGWGGWGRRGFGSLAWEAPYDYREGRVTVNLYDAHSHAALWHAYVDTDVTGLTGANAEQRIKAVVDAIFKKYPSGGAIAAGPASRT
jgi:hypothetical protein